MLRTFQALNRVDPGFTKPEQIQTLRIAIPPALATGPEQVVRTQQRIQEKLAPIPGVAKVGFAGAIRTDGQPPNWDSIGVQDRPLPPGEFGPMRRYKYVSPGFLEAMGTRLSAGRAYTWADLVERRPVILISENMAKEYWGDARSAIGKQVGNATLREVIGVVQDVYDNGVQDVAPASVYWPTYGSNAPAQNPPAVTRNVAFTIRSPRAGSAEFLHEIEQAVWSVNSNLSIAAVQSMAELHGKSIARTSFTLVMLAIAGGMALLLGIIGIYGVLAYTVAQRRTEVGIRMALGVAPGAVKKMFLLQGLTLTGIGIAVGLALAFGVSRLLETLLFQVKPFDPVTYAATAAILTVAAAVASYLPARRATTVSPVEALRAE